MAANVRMTWRSDAIRTELAVKARKGTQKAAKVLVRAVKAAINDPTGRSGRVYIIGGVPHVSSAPGEVPSAITGQLASSIASSPKETKDAVTQFVGANRTVAPYAAELELGTISGGRIASRPFLRPVAEMNRPQLLGIMKAEFE